MTKRLSAFLVLATVIAGMFAPTFSYNVLAAPDPPACDCANLSTLTGGNLARCALACTGKEGLKTDPAKQYKQDDIAQIIGQIINTILLFLGVIFMVLVIYSGATWMLAAGEAEKIESAQATLKSSVIGVIIVVSSYVLMNFVFINLLGMVFG